MSWVWAILFDLTWHLEKSSYEPVNKGGTNNVFPQWEGMPQNRDIIHKDRGSTEGRAGSVPSIRYDSTAPECRARSNHWALLSMTQPSRIKEKTKKKKQKPYQDFLFRFLPAEPQEQKHTPKREGASLPVGTCLLSALGSGASASVCKKMCLIFLSAVFVSVILDSPFVTVVLGWGGGDSD